MALAGCSDSGRVPVFPVQGQVLFDGKPATGAHVVFHPVGKSGGGALRPAGQVDHDGKFTLTTFQSGDGAPEGEYAVTVELWESKNDNPAVNRLPGRYQQAKTSGLTAKVAPGENQVPVFKLAK
jgi:hypothetical protein